MGFRPWNLGQSVGDSTQRSVQVKSRTNAVAMRRRVISSPKEHTLRSPGPECIGLVCAIETRLPELDSVGQLETGLAACKVLSQADLTSS